jgi:hypothetical protein
MPLIQLEDEKYSTEDRENIHMMTFLILIGMIAYIGYFKIRNNFKFILRLKSWEMNSKK